MVIAGAGGHGMEVFEVLKKSKFGNFIFFDENPSKSSPYPEIPMISNPENLKNALKQDPYFVLGVGNPVARERLHSFLIYSGGKYRTVLSNSSHVSSDLISNGFEAMEFSYIGPKCKFGTGVLINTRANVHHECEIGSFSEIGPGAMLLGAVKVGAKCRIGAGAVILPGLKLGDNVVVGAGAVVTKDIGENQTVIGIPAVSLRKT
ncbi:NeuD/PglB/VioB family sugar acetyltransferase [Algoriphagus sp.]|jgi:sugar O-acyltransferase (sialic acid O-acetyltransferase NeuD family)|uniref:NeuD/PglB/VioB family sugar acetyltransferase n=1 Tax=Algoriphagus sp. TaxID=1872435 RepID=UPI00271C8FF0|nr:NeuD/PglB/VioB family sugar acetyltransferase [Algoriphagus sp.]MDO8967508.1 NeuD/PglB/VioB family sugar acetyltransferase [Algoriphagus sp.]MDP3201818.1 NeuD/PglB/VioB family sugar acetyltransferase [Algoriphagus sp.]